MRDFRDAKAMAQSLRQALSDRSVTVTHSDCLELVSKAFGLDNWNVLAAKIEAALPAPAGPEGAGKTLFCSFCGKSQYDVDSLIAGPDVFICNECVGLCDNINRDKKFLAAIAEARARRPDLSPLEAAAEALHDVSDSQLEASRQGCLEWLEHIDWSVRQVDAALAGRQGEPWKPDEIAMKRGWARSPLAGKSRAEIETQREHLLKRRAEVGERLDLLTQVFADRAAPAEG